MQNIFVLTETFTNGYKLEILDFLFITSIISGILVITNKNPVVSVLFLIGLFLSISSYFIILGMNFIGLSYILVYVGAVSILFLFILMLINVRNSELSSNTNSNIPLAIFISLAFIYPIYQISPYSLVPFKSYIFSFHNALNGLGYNFYTNFINKVIPIQNNELEYDIYFVTSKIWDGNLAETTHITSIGNIMYTTHSMWLIISSIILLLAMVGVIAITIKTRKNYNQEGLVQLVEQPFYTRYVKCSSHLSLIFS